MSKFKIGDKVRLKANAEDWGWTKEHCDEMKKQVFVVGDDKIGSPITDTILECVTNYPDDFELVPTPHVHHDMIVEWAKNPTRIVQFCDNDIDAWYDVVDNQPYWTVGVKYRFKPVEPERVFPKTSLGIKELASHVISENETVSIASLEAIANAAIKQYILDMKTSEGKT